MATVFHHKLLHAGTHYRLWLILAALMAFLLAAFWAQPVH